MEGARLRFRAILMTTLSFVLGVIPLVVASGAGAASRWSLGTAVFAGMTTATLLSVFFIPVLYYAIEMLLDKLRGTRVTSAEGKPALASQSSREEGGDS